MDGAYLHEPMRTGNQIPRFHSFTVYPFLSYNNNIVL